MHKTEAPPRRPTASVVIATYNRHARIARTLDSVLAQSVPALEILVVDDGSTDDTGQWIHAHYPNVTVLTFPNGGTSTARNRGAAAARGDVLVFIDHDDDMKPNTIETLLGCLARFPSARAAFADHTLHDLTSGEHFPNHHTAIPAFGRMRRIRALETNGRARLYGAAMHDALLRGNLLQQPWAIYRDSFNELGGFDSLIRYCEDWELYLRVTETFRIVLSDEVISDHFIEGANLHRAAGQEAQHMKVLRKHLRRAGWRHPRRAAILRQRLAQYHKSAGDHYRRAGEPAALNEYIAACQYCPFDAHVAARCVTWSLGRITGLT
jgi:glycosyltransferase involved in cell wall biosynthesis